MVSGGDVNAQEMSCIKGHASLPCSKEGRVRNKQPALPLACGLAGAAPGVLHSVFPSMTSLEQWCE